MVSTDRFRQEIKSRLQLAGAQGQQDLTIECGELYRSVSKLPVFDPWMIFCCNAMRAEMAKTDRLVFDDLLCIAATSKSGTSIKLSRVGSNSLHLRAGRTSLVESDLAPRISDRPGRLF